MEEDAEEGDPPALQHDDDIGEEVPYEESEMICESIVRLVRVLSCAAVSLKPARHSALLPHLSNLHSCFSPQLA